MTTNTRVPVLIGGGAGLTASMLLGTLGVDRAIDLGEQRHVVEGASA